jgi:xylulose-5-phosphate/fructose-6-phosphate phosphoketolase
MVVMNDLDRFHLVIDVIDRVPALARRAAVVRQGMVDKRAEHHTYVRDSGVDLPEVAQWMWPTS